MARALKRFCIREAYIHECYGIAPSRFSGWGYSRFHGMHDIGYFSHHTYTPYCYPPRRGALISNRSNNIHHTLPPALSQHDEVIAKLEASILENKPEQLAKLLREDFIFEHKGTEVEKDIHTDTLTEVQGHIYTYQLCVAQPTIEYLITGYNNIFRRMLKLAKEIDSKANSTKLYRGILRQLFKLDLEDADLSQLDLIDANLNDSKLKKTNLRDSKLHGALANQSDLEEAIITKKQVASLRQFVDAKMPKGFWQYWNDSTQKSVLRNIHELWQYGLKLKKEGVAKGEQAIQLAARLTADIHRPGAVYNEIFQRKFLHDLHSLDHVFKKHRSYKRIIANIALCALGGIVFYLLAAGINKKLTGHFTFFAETKTGQLINKIDDSFAHETPSMTTLLSGLHPKAGKKAPLHTFLGRHATGPKKGLSLHPLGDQNVLRLVKKFTY